jgi:hypothetical protein
MAPGTAAGAFWSTTINDRTRVNSGGKALNMNVRVLNNDISKAVKVLKRKFIKEVSGALWLRSFPKPSDKKKEKKHLAQRRKKKRQARY